MGFAWSHTTYALWHDLIFNFEDKWDLDYFLTHAEGSKRVSSTFAYQYVYDYKHQKDFIRVFSSRCLGANKYRQRRIKEWKRMAKLDNDELEKLYIEYLENEEIKKDSELYCEHEDAGDRV